MLWVGASSTPALLLHRRLDGGSGVLRLLLLSVVNQVTVPLFSSLDLSFPFTVVVVDCCCLHHT